MRTTIDIPERLLRHAKARAALQGLRLKDIVRDALQRHLEDAGDLREPGGCRRSRCSSSVQAVCSRS